MHTLVFQKALMIFEIEHKTCQILIKEKKHSGFAIFFSYII